MDIILVGLESTPFNLQINCHCLMEQLLVLQLSVPILNGFATRGRVQHAKINQERSEFQLKQAELDLEQKCVYQAYNDVINAKKSFDAAQKL